MTYREVSSLPEGGKTIWPLRRGARTSLLQRSNGAYSTYNGRPRNEIVGDEGARPMTSLPLRSAPRGPECVASSAENFGQRLTFEVSHEDFHLHKYECAPGGGWEHDALAFCRIAIQDLGSPKMERDIEGHRERQIRPVGKISISPSNTSQRWSWDCKMRVTLLFVSQRVIEEIAAEAGISKRFSQISTPLVTDDNLIKHTVAELAAECAVSSKVSRLLVGTAGRHVAAHLIARYAQAGQPQRDAGMVEWKLKRALDFIEQNLGHDIGLDELASNSDMTPHYFCRAFRKSVGMPPYRYLVRRRIERSKELLASTDNEVTDIALELGFSSHAHFCNTFRSVVDCSPSTFRKVSRS
ncbi:AraC family transcriptional regulator [Nitrobacteraceae bacterium AZCC 2161]